jgi:endonuclease/exonuclease/phosphatase family metal-dependent hydrolase
LLYLIAYVSPAFWWVTGLVSFVVPLVLLSNIFILLFLLIRFKVASLYFIFSLIIGYSHLRNTFAINFSKEIKEDAITVLNYNVRVFNVYEHLRDKKHELPKNQIKWVAEHEADIKCFQEYYNEPNSDIYNTSYKLGKQKGYYSFIHTTTTNRIKAQFGLAIFSKYKIVNKGVIDYLKRTNNDVIFVDIKIKNDTIRVYNAHLQSLSIEEGEIESIYTEKPKRKKDLIRLKNRFKVGFVERSKQVDMLFKHIESCKYPVILCGDFNDLPYSYTYHKIDELLENSFVDAGFGFGFTHNGGIPFLRIDNQFYSAEKFKAYNFKVEKSVVYSDHYPLVCQYQLK